MYVVFILLSFFFSFFLGICFLFFFVVFFFCPNCGCVAMLLDWDPSDKSILLAKLWLPPSGECERAAMSHLRDLFSFLPLSWIQPCTCPWGGNICHTYWSAWMGIHSLFQKCLLLAFGFVYKNVHKVNFGLSFTVPFYLGASAGLSLASVDLLYDYLGL